MTAPGSSPRRTRALVAVLAASPFVTALVASSVPRPSRVDELHQFLDRDGDGRVHRYEGAEALLMLVEESDTDGDDAVTFDELEAFLLEERRGDLDERREVFAELDRDDDGALVPDEVPFDFQSLFATADADADGALSLDELLAARSLGDPRELFRAELRGFLAEVDADGDGAITRDEVPDDAREFAEDVWPDLDADGDERLTEAELLQLADLEFGGATFEPDGDVAHMRGVIGPTTPGRVLELVLEHPAVETIVMHDVPGSMDDEANLRAARMVRRLGLATHLPEGGEVASGGTDFFLAGARRTADAGSRFGVHSWGDGDVEGADVPRDDEEHQLYLDFYHEVGIDAAFYWYTLEAAGADDIHWMTPEEIVRYDVLTAGPVPQGRAAPELGEDDDDEYALPDEVLELEIDTSASPDGVVPVPDHAPHVLRETFERYTRLVAPNGKPIHLFAQRRVTNEMLVRAREVMRFYLTDAPGTRFGADKRAVWNAMGDRAATLVYFDSERAAHRAFRGELGELPVFGQDLYATESVVEGSREYLDNSVRDATLEEVFHLVHGAGIRPALPEYHARIEAATRAALVAGSWETNPEWRREGIEAFEYVISVIDVLYGLWAHDPDGDGVAFHGEYMHHTPTDARAGDPLGVEVVHEFLPGSFAFDASVAASFEGTFLLEPDDELPYTLKSRHLTRVRLTGEHASNLVGNDLDNRLTGNGAANVLEGRGGDDRIDGGGGRDVVVLRGPRAEYQVERTAAGWRLTDQAPDRDGEDTLVEVERVRFADVEVAVEELAR